MSTNWAVKRLWSLYSWSYDGLLDLLPYQDLVADTVEALDCGPGSQVADLGCGTANVTAAILRTGVELTAIRSVDLSPEMLRAAERKVGHDERVSLERSDVNTWLAAQPDNSLDRIVSSNVVYTFDVDQREEFWSQCRRVLRDDGRAVVVSTDREGFGPVAKEQYRRRGGLRKGLSPRLTAAAVMNLGIWFFESRKVFHPVSIEQLETEAVSADLGVVRSWRSYGGATDGVAVTIVVEPVLDISTGGAESAIPINEAGSESDSVPAPQV